MDCDALREGQWGRLKEFEPGGRKGKRGSRADNRRFLNALLWMARFCRVVRGRIAQPRSQRFAHPPLGGALDVDRVELALRIIRLIQLDLLALVSVWRIEPGAVSRLFIEPLTDSERAMANCDKG